MERDDFVSSTTTKMTTKSLVVSALLTAIGILIPIIMQPPFKILIEPMSFTLASHVPVMVAMFISPLSAGIVAIGTALGFLLSGMPLVIAVRALSHIIFALVGAWMIQKERARLSSIPSLILLAVVTGVLHGACEMISILPFYFGGALAEGFYETGFLYSVLGLVGFGTVIHSWIDFVLSVLIVKALKRANVFIVK